MLIESIAEARELVRVERLEGLAAYRAANADYEPHSASESEVDSDRSTRTSEDIMYEPWELTAPGPTRRKRRRKDATEDEPPVSYTKKDEDDDDDNDQQPDRDLGPAQSSSNSTAFALTSAPTEGENCLIDSGCSTTTMRSRARFTVWKEISKEINTASHSVVINRSGPVGPFENVYFMPSLHTNLVSMGDIDDLGIDLTIKEGLLTMWFNDRQVLSIMKKKNVWVVNTDLLISRILEIMGDEVSFWWMAPAIADQLPSKCDRLAKDMFCSHS